MRLTRPNARTAHTYLAGVGASGALLAGAVVVLLILLPIVAFNSWPEGAGVSRVDEGAIESVNIGLAADVSDFELPFTAAESAIAVADLGGGTPSGSGQAGASGGGGGSVLASPPGGGAVQPSSGAGTGGSETSGANGGPQGGGGGGGDDDDDDDDGGGGGDDDDDDDRGDDDGDDD
jgi:hypothetical protein